MNMAEAYSTLYKPRVALGFPHTDIDEFIEVSNSDIVSISFIHNYDVALYPIIRVRLYTDISALETITTYPDDLWMLLNLNGNVYNMNKNEDSDGNGSLQIVDGSKNYDVALKAYIENKNTLTSKMDQYDHGIKKTSALNENVKVPITLYGYDQQMINSMKYQAQGIYKNMDITSIIEAVTDICPCNLDMDPVQNQTKYEQILLPNVSVRDTLMFFDRKYGLYPKGGNMYCDYNNLYVVDTDVNAGDTPIPIYVESYKSASDSSGLRKYANTNPKYMFNTKAANVSVLTETDIEKTLNSCIIQDINVNSTEARKAYLYKIYTEKEVDAFKRIDENKNIELSVNAHTPDTLHKFVSPYVSSTNAARITERVTRVDVSGVGFDVFRITPRTRFNLIFESPIRGMSINQRYRANTVVHTFSNLSSDLFVAQTTMHLCTN